MMMDTLLKAYEGFYSKNMRGPHSITMHPADRAHLEEENSIRGNQMIKDVCGIQILIDERILEGYFRLENESDLHWM